MMMMMMILPTGSFHYLLPPENNFQEIRCANVFEAMRKCCLKHKPVSLVCDGYRLEPRVFAPATDRPTKDTSG
ncbi:jg6792 [Pararge aegeria aegeria]|uniref:Jg6792 protein n=1 Tax=Pararge aegeria aegeria TaxID=348720 RepID=A0A8S4RRF3_9NEOP|nr:jg6792 [Pararge aegeria aegeria]